MFPHGLEGIWLSVGFPPRSTQERRLWTGEHDQKQKPTVEDGQTAQEHQTLLIKKEENKAGNRGRDGEMWSRCWPAPF